MFNYAAERFFNRNRICPKGNKNIDVYGNYVPVLDESSFDTSELSLKTSPKKTVCLINNSLSMEIVKKYIR